MAVSEILGLFQTPDQYTAAQDAAMQQQFTQRATLSPFQKASVLGQQAGYSAAQGIGGALGGKDPQLEMISRRNVLLSQLDPNDPKSYGRVAEAAARMGDSQFAVAIAQEGRKASSELALALQRTAEKMTPEERNAAAYARSVAEPGTPQYNSIYQTTLQALISKEKPDLTTPDQKNARDFALRAGPEGSPAYNEAYIAKLEQFTTKPESRPVIKEIGVAKGTEEAVYTYQQGNNPPQQVVYKTVNGQQQIVPYSGPVDRTTAKTTNQIPLGDVLQKVFQSKVVEDAAKAFGQAGDAYTLTVPMIKKLETVESTVNNAFTGAASNINLTISKGLSALGVKVSDRATDTEIGEAISAQVVQQIAKVFPGSQSNKELDQLLKSKFNLKQELPTILRLVSQIKDEMLAQTKTYEQMANLPANERTDFNAKLAQGQNYQKIQQYRDYEKKYLNRTITAEERAQAAKLKKELNF